MTVSDYSANDGRAASSRDIMGRSLVTRSSLTRALRTAGLSNGDVVCAHVGISKLGYVCGGAQTIIDALLDAIGPAGTLVMPAFSGELSDPASWRAPPVPNDWIDVIRLETPPYDQKLTPTRDLGVTAELFRNRPGVVRSSHPHSSFAAYGPSADLLLARRGLDYRFGPDSPLGALSALDGKVVMLGTDKRRATLIYLAQYLLGFGPEILKASPVTISGETTWVEYRDIGVDNRLVSSGVEFLIQTGIASGYQVGDGSALVFSAREALVALLEWKWRDTGIDIAAAPARKREPLPRSWSDWLESRNDVAR